MDAVASHRSRSWLYAVGGVSIGVLVVLVSSIVPGYAGVLTHSACVRGKVIANENFWTPFTLVNAPYLGATTWGASFSVFDLAPGQINLSRGNLSGGNLSTGYFETQNWSIYPEVNSSEPGPGKNVRCDAGYAVLLSPSNFNSATDGPVLQGPGNTSNLMEPTVYSPDGRPAAVFSNGFVVSNAEPITTCGAAGRVITLVVTGFQVRLTGTGAGGPFSVVFTVDSRENFRYFFPPDGGTWSIDNLSAPGGPGGGWAFSYAPCA